MTAKMKAKEKQKSKRRRTETSKNTTPEEGWERRGNEGWLRET